MIETKRTVTTLDGKTVELKKGGPQIIELELKASFVNDITGGKEYPFSVTTAHVTREVLERCGRLPIADLSTVKEVCATPEDLLRALLESIGVVFE